MHRRKFLYGLAATVVASPSAADITCGPQNFQGVRQCVVGLQNLPVIQQKCQQWCWAACAELAFAAQGYAVPQQWFVEKVHQPGSCAPAVGPQIATAINGPWTDVNGQTFHAQARPLMDLDYNINHPDPLQVVRNELQANRIVIAGTLNHAICITAMQYAENSFGQRQILGMTVRDPWPLRPNRRQMTLQEFYAGRFLMTVAVT